jgi:N-acetyl-gamma-glutamylphosphate reductase
VLYNEHPDYEYACLVRSKDKGEKVKKAYPNVRIVLGGLDDSEILEEEASRADIVLRSTPLTGSESRLMEKQMRLMHPTTRVLLRLSPLG